MRTSLPSVLFSILASLSILLFSCRSDGTGGQRGEDRVSPGMQENGEAIITARTMGLAYLEENNLEEAEAQFMKLIRLAPDEAIGYANLGLVYLRMGNYDESEKNLKKALELTPEDADIRLNLATVYKYRNQDAEFLKELERAIRDQPDHVQSIYRLAEYYGGKEDPASLQKREEYLKRTLEVAPANIVPRLYLVETLIQNGKRDEAIQHLEEVRRLFPEFPDEALEHYRSAVEALRSGNMEQALTSALIFHNFLKLTNPYNQGVTDLQGFQGMSAGKPVFTFSKATTTFAAEGGSILEALRFTDVTDLAGLSSYGGESGVSADQTADAPVSLIATGDFDHDGVEDLYLGTLDKGGNSYHHYLLRSELGRFLDVTSGTGLKPGGEETQASFTDYDNDGWFDLLLVSRGEPLLYHSVSQGKYQEVTRQAFPEGAADVLKGLYVDMDHEGDLDLFFSTLGYNRMYRNNGDGTFSDWTEESGVKGDPGGSYESCFADFDDDGDVDLFVVNREAPCQLFTNLREGRFREASVSSGLDGLNNKRMVAEGDYNNDGYMDLFVAGESPSTFQLFINSGRNGFHSDPHPALFGNLPGGFRARDAQFFDFDNDGHLDLLIVGDPGSTGVRGAFLFHNDREGGFKEMSQLLPEGFPGGNQIAVADYNDDGDLDIFLAGLDGGAMLLRNDGGNANRHLKMRLVGIRSGSGKNNYYGIGARVELRAGNLYQMKVVTDPDIHFGLADREDVDVVRILWTNGTPQNIFNPGIDQDLIEEQQLKGSCPFLYAWDGEAYVFVKDIMWRSALGMPMGIMGEEQTYAFADASRDYHKIPGELLRPRNGRYSIQVTGELWETLYMDEIQLLTVDHPDSVDIYVDERFSPPPYPPLKILRVASRIYPEKALDGLGNEVSELLREKDDRYVGAPFRGRYQGITETSELILDPGRLPRTDSVFLLLNGWIFPTDASINLALSQGDNEKVVPPCLQVLNARGEWETVIDNIGFPQGKDKTLIVDLSGKFLSGDQQVRIVTNMELYWDQAFFTTDCHAPVEISNLHPEAADHHYRGFSRMYRKGGRYGPHWFEYQTVTTEPKWRDLEGWYTRYGDVTELLQASDNMYIIANAGDETTVEFDAEAAVPLPTGWHRDFLVYSIGWVKDGDMNTAEGNRVEPLPFHGMKQYPYAPGETYPATEALEKYQKEYNTREVTDREFRREVIERK